MLNESSYYSAVELAGFGFKKIGIDVRISRKCSIYSADRMSIGDHVRIDDFCLLSGEIALGSYIHLSAYSALFGGSGIFIDDFCGVSARVSVYSVNDDYSGNSMVGPTIPDVYRNIKQAPVYLQRHVIVGAGSVILPGVVLAEACAVGALSLVNTDLEPWTIYAGIPARRIRERLRELLLSEQTFLKTINEP